MNARTELAGILEQWQQLTQDEGVAIQTAAWPMLAQIQARKAALQKSLATAFEKSDGGGVSVSIRAEAGRILSLLTRNGEALAAKLRQARARQSALEDSNRTLNKIQQSYASARPPEAWQSYS